MVDRTYWVHNFIHILVKYIFSIPIQNTTGWNRLSLFHYLIYFSSHNIFCGVNKDLSVLYNNNYVVCACIYTMHAHNTRCIVVSCLLSYRVMCFVAFNFVVVAVIWFDLAMSSIFHQRVTKICLCIIRRTIQMNIRILLIVYD